MDSQLPVPADPGRSSRLDLEEQRLTYNVAIYNRKIISALMTRYPTIHFATTNTTRGMSIIEWLLAIRYEPTHDEPWVETERGKADLLAALDQLNSPPA